MKLMTKELEKRLPMIGETDGNPDKYAQVKFFTPDANWAWYAIEYDPKHRMFFGWVDGIEPEYGYFSLDELEQTRGPLGLKIERDVFFEPLHMSTIVNYSIERR